MRLFSGALLLLVVASFAVRPPVPFDLPDAANPLDGLLPRGGMMEHPRWGYLKISDKTLKTVHSVNFQTREVRIRRYFLNGLGGDSTVLWTSYYQELADYSFDMQALGLRNLWLASLIGQADGGVSDDGSFFDISIPVNMPLWMSDFGLDKPKLKLQGDMTVRFWGKGIYKDPNDGSRRTSLWPSPQLYYDPRFLIQGSVGRNITIEIDNRQNFGVRNELRVIYKEAEPGEFDDHILQEVEAGNTSLELKGTELTGYSENHKGLFGIKAKFKVGDVYITTIASQEGGSQESQTLNQKATETEFSVRDKDFVSYRHYFLTPEDRDKYIEKQRDGINIKLSKSELNIYREARVGIKNNVLENMTAVYYDKQGNASEEIRYAGLRLEKLKAKDYSYDANTRTITINSGRRSSIFAFSYNGDRVGNGSRTLRSGGTVVLFKDKTNTHPELLDLMKRNHYAVGYSEENMNNFFLDMLDKDNRPGSFLYQLGLADSTGKVYRNDRKIFHTSTGEMELPCPEIDKDSLPSWAPTERVKKKEWLDRICLEPMRVLDSSMAKMYDSPIHDLSRVESRYYFNAKGKRRSSSISISNNTHSVNSGGCIDISPGSEKLKLKSGATLERGVDYEVLYELGQINLMSDRAKDPNEEISLTYECNPLFQIENKILLGSRIEYKLDKFDEGSHLGATLLYKSQSTTEKRPYFGREPFKSFLWGLNMRLIERSRWMSKAINALPFIHSNAPSRWSFEAEMARTLHDANTKGSALVDDFESSKREIPFSLRRTSWYAASPPSGNVTEPFFDDFRDFRHQGEFIWHSNLRKRFRHIYPSSGYSRIDNTVLTVLKLTLRPNDNLVGNSWGGVMRANSEFYRSMNQYRILELVVHGNSGKLHIDLGRISEDISIAGYKPNGELNTEKPPGTIAPLNDYGLDQESESDETFKVWTCSFRECREKILTATDDPASIDPGRDDFEFEKQRDASDPRRTINGTEGNAAEKIFDTEDLDGSGALDRENEFVRYTIDLSATGNYEELRPGSGWKRYRIPLEKFSKVFSAKGSTAEQILADVPMTRIWYDSLPRGVSEGQVQIAKFAVVGNQWEESDRSTNYEVAADATTQLVDVDGEIRALEYRRESDTPDSNFIDVRVINNRDNTDYYRSPNTKEERDRDTGTPLREQSLVLNYGNLHPNQDVHVTRFFDTDVKDLTLYERLKMEIHLDSIGDNPENVRLALQFGQGSLEGSSNYYEWSYRPRTLDCDAIPATPECHDRNWRNNAVNLLLRDWPELKNNPAWHPPFREPVSRLLVDGKWTSFDTPDELRAERRRLESEFPTNRRERAEMITVVGNPSISRITWMRFVVQVDDPLDGTDRAAGVFWINDLRLEGIESVWGTAARTHLQLEFSDVMTVSGTMGYRDGDFAPLGGSGTGSPKPSLAESKSNVNFTTGAKFQLDKFFPDRFGFQMPLGVSYSGELTRPYVKPNSDIQLSRDKADDIFPELLNGNLPLSDTAEEAAMRRQAESRGFQTYTETKTFSISYAKEYKRDRNFFADLATQVFLERPKANYSYQGTEVRSSLATDSSYTYTTSLAYNLAPFERKRYRPFSFLKKKKWGKKLSRMTFSPWPQTFDVTLADFTYHKSLLKNRDPELVSDTIPRILDYNLDLSHRATVNWTIFPFLSTSYTLTIKRDMDTDQKSFTREKFFSSTGSGGLFAKGLIFDTDHSDKRVRYLEGTIIRRDTIYAITQDNEGNPVLDSEGNPLRRIDGIVMVRDTTVQLLDKNYEVVDDPNRAYDYGKEYGILRNERARNQTFGLNFSPNLFAFFTTRFNFSSSFGHVKRLPENHDYKSWESQSDNYWSVEQSNRFEFSPSLKLRKIFAFSKNIESLFKKISWNSINGKWSVDLNSSGEDFTLQRLSEYVDPADYYLYSFGLGDGTGWRGPWNVFTGEMDKKNPHDWEKFGEYRNQKVDSLVDLVRFRRGIKRRASLSSRFIVPWGKISVNNSAYWTQQFNMYRETPFYLDTTITWPHYSTNVSVPDFSKKFSWSKNHLKRLAASSRYEYKRERVSHPFQSLEDERNFSWNFNPLLKISATTTGGIQITNSMRYARERRERYTKVGVITEGAEYLSPDSLYWQTPWVWTDQKFERTWAVGDDLGITYNLKTGRGIQIWKWYLRLDNDIRLKWTTSFDFTKTVTRDSLTYVSYNPLDSTILLPSGETLYLIPAGWSVDRGNGPEKVYLPTDFESGERLRPVRKWKLSLSPEAAYDFSKKIQTSAFVRYSFERSSREEEEKPLDTQELWFEVALKMKFN